MSRAPSPRHAPRNPNGGTLAAACRGAFLNEIGDRIRARQDELAILLTRETGKPLCESVDCIDAASPLFEASAARASHRSGPPGRQPAGVLAAITPFNFPLLLMACKVAPAIAAGDGRVQAAAPEPAREPAARRSLRRPARRRGQPRHRRPETGRALVGHPDVGGVSFTGSAEVGRRIAAAAAHKRVDLELGRVDSFIVCRDADLDVSVPGIVWARLCNGGQVCTSGKHIYVERPIVDEFVERMHQCVGFLDIDDPMRRATDLGPLISLEAAHRVEDQVGRSLRGGATLILGGRRFRPSGLPGHFFQPTILSNVRPGSVPTREEILGPVITITPVADAAEALRFAGESGCGASIYTSDVRSAMRAAESYETGTFRINDPATGARAFGGLRHGGIRRALAGERAAQVAEMMERKPWWFPYRDRLRGEP